MRILFVVAVIVCVSCRINHRLYLTPVMKSITLKAIVTLLLQCRMTLQLRQSSKGKILDYRYTIIRMLCRLLTRTLGYVLKRRVNTKLVSNLMYLLRMTAGLLLRARFTSRVYSIKTFGLSVLLRTLRPYAAGLSTRLISPEHYLIVSTTVRMTIRLLWIVVKVPMRTTCTPTLVNGSRMFVKTTIFTRGTGRIRIARSRGIGLRSLNGEIGLYGRRMMVVRITVKQIYYPVLMVLPPILIGKNGSECALALTSVNTRPQTLMIVTSLSNKLIYTRRMTRTSQLVTQPMEDTAINGFVMITRRPD